MKKLHKTQWLELALDKKDSTRPFTTSLYRATNELVATDGHRLHLQSGLVDSPTYMLSNEDVAYPDYKLAILEKGDEFEITFTTDKYRCLIDALNYLIKLRVSAVSFSMFDNNISISGVQGKDTYSQAHIKAIAGDIRYNDYRPDFTFSAHYNPVYLRDALRIFETSGTNTATLNILDDKSPFHIKADDLHAVVMPMKA